MRANSSPNFMQMEVKQISCNFEISVITADCRQRYWYYHFTKTRLQLVMLRQVVPAGCRPVNLSNLKPHNIACCLPDVIHEIPLTPVYAVWEAAWDFEFDAISDCFQSCLNQLKTQCMCFLSIPSNIKKFIRLQGIYKMFSPMTFIPIWQPVAQRVKLRPTCSQLQKLGPSLALTLYQKIPTFLHTMYAGANGHKLWVFLQSVQICMAQKPTIQHEHSIEYYTDRQDSYHQKVMLTI